MALCWHRSSLECPPLPPRQYPKRLCRSYPQRTTASATADTVVTPDRILLGLTRACLGRDADRLHLCWPRGSSAWEGASRMCPQRCDGATDAPHGQHRAV